MLERSQNHNLPDPPVFPLLPLRGMIVFPYTVTPLEVGRPSSLQALEVATLGQRCIVLAAQKEDPRQEHATADIQVVATMCEIKKEIKLPEGQQRVLNEGKRSVRNERIEQDDPYFQTLVLPSETLATESGALLEALV